MESITSFLSVIGQEIEDADEESFLLFSQDIPSSNLGFVDSKATSVDISIHNQEYTIHQSPTLLSSSRAGGTTGAVLWKITPLFAEWLSNQPSNPLWTHSILRPSSTVVELGCGISALTALTLSPLLEPHGNGNGHYIATDQEYVHRLFRQNLLSNPPRPSASASTKKSKSQSKGKKGQKYSTTNTNTNTNTGGTEDQSTTPHQNITFTSLDWETDHPETLKQQIQHQSTTPSQDNGADEEEDNDSGFDLLLSCDCIYNEALISPFVRACAEIARLRPIFSSNPEESSSYQRQQKKPTICIIAQQQRSPDVFEAWLRETMRYFRVWRVADDVLGQRLGVGSGYLVHVLVLKA
ncbi:S-adenosylmethionine-dependent methyltransferase [Aspergillus puulaauensis]|uniref:Methyltransferase-domain-containing protein n=1 Tax=Aspergillus puulaauensis TaxID=1220207 RepID=A0A7R7XBG3_9EURO|nr:uncharacterized protein APUU_11057A [Aspergillus puulaauensis]BCS18229.1 hypothetical protein APUU_11057A [Aspergillus puulaauensis]